MNKKQQRNLDEAKKILKRGISNGSTRDWDNLFENGYNDANSLVWELYKEAMADGFMKTLMSTCANKPFLPSILTRALFLEGSNDG